MIQKKDLYSVYTHTSPSGKVYVGVSNNPKRRWGTYGAPYLCKTKNGNYAQSCFANAILKYGWNNFKHEILLENISFNEALYAERYLIRWYKIHNMSYNMSDGGEYFSGSRGPLSEERKRQIKEFMNTHHPMKGKHHTSEARAKMSEATKNRMRSPERRVFLADVCRRAHLGKKLSEETKKKISDVWMGTHGELMKAVNQYSLDGKYITTYNSIIEAVRKTTGCKCGIGSCCRHKPKYKTSGGYLWEYDNGINRKDMVI